MLDGELVDKALLLAELFVELVLWVGVEGEVLDGGVMGAVLEVGLDTQFSLKVKLRNALKFLIQPRH